MKRRNTWLALVPVLAVAAAASAATPFGPSFGANRFHTAIVDQPGQPDSDDYVAPLLAGEKLTVALKADKGSALVPVLRLVHPDGTVILPPRLVVKNDGRSVTLAAFVVPATGRWAVRVSGSNGSEGGYSVAFKIAPAPAAKSAQTVTSGASGTVVAFDAVAGAHLDLTMKFSRAAPVQLASIEDPRGATVPAVSPTGGRTSLAVRKLALPLDGTYKLHLTTVVPTASSSVSVKVTAQGRPRAGRAVELSADEPQLNAVATPLRGVFGRHVVFDGANFSAANPPLVLFGTKPAFSTVVVGGGAGLDCIAPDVAEGTTVSVTVIAKDGQMVVGENYFYFIPTPTVLELVNDQDGITHSGPKAGGNLLFLRGTGFEDGMSVKFGTVPGTVVDVVDPTRMQIQVPAGTGLVQIYVIDTFGRVAQANFSYLYN